MSNSTFWIVISVIGIATILQRGSFILTAERFKLSDKFSEILRFIPASVLAALIAPAIFYHEGMVASLHGKERLSASIFALLVAYKSRNIFFTILTGMGTLYLLQYFL
ncbi:AzlD domain-containing protein [Halodesulfovibrio marinisediminis]|uniref:Branched-chain amino acid transport protein n=1 Tax=Halodesulfovibrio marinisediminis DSM 17456 TaxID=1121457 RepID=A0A1N6J6J0_9BACT|nr:AzlD domain-containing protein [Halodesulfovibrio marinisediminis]SIO39861.1 Branched-chain amino acid transport protein [Halodesulfovibrio marinisediminis DSM 17456]